jgi:hypothetical protein
MKSTGKKIAIGTLAVAIFGSFMAFNSAKAREPFTKAELADQESKRQ